MTSLEERVTYLEGRFEDHTGALNDLRTGIGTELSDLRTGMGGGPLYYK